MNRKRNVRVPLDLRTVSERQEKVLIALERYDHLDSKHLSLLTGLSRDNLKKPLRDLFDAGLILRPPQRNYKRDTLNDSQVYKRTSAGTDWLERHNLLPPRAAYIGAGGQPPHDLAVSQLLVCIEMAHREAGLPFFTIEEIIAAAPEETRRLKTPHRFETSNGHIIPDAMFSTQYGDEFLLSFMEVNLSDHGEAKYQKKARAYAELIFRGIYKTQLGMQQYARILTFDNSNATMKDMLKHTEARDPAFFKLIPSYGRFEAAPPPVENILENWRDVKGRLADLRKEELNERKAG
jgi:hypothetical protein